MRVKHVAPSTIFIEEVGNSKWGQQPLVKNQFT